MAEKPSKTSSKSSLRSILPFLSLLFPLCLYGWWNTVLPSADELENGQGLKGSEWYSDFYYYHNEYFFETDSTGYSKDGQFIWSAGIDPKLYENLPDTTYVFEEEEKFNYALKDSILTITYLSDWHDDDNRHRIFKAKMEKNGNLVFISDYEYAYGREYLNLKTKD